ncbi:MAG: hypothetical protein AB2690_15270 [Candidatus Thiodiazotropha endolucinida]
MENLPDHQTGCKSAGVLFHQGTGIPPLQEPLYFVDTDKPCLQRLPLDGMFQFRQGIGKTIMQFESIMVIKEAGLNGSFRRQARKGNIVADLVDIL